MRHLPPRGSLVPVGWVLLASVAAAPLFARIPVTWDVDSSVACGDPACTPCCTIQGAVAKCVGGDSVRVFAGLYAENVDLSSMASLGDLTIFAEGGPGTVEILPATGMAVTNTTTMPGTVTLRDLDLRASADTGGEVTADGDIVVSGLVVDACFDDGLVLSSLAGSISVSATSASGNGGRGLDLSAHGNVTVVGSQANGNSGSAGMAVETTGAGADVHLSNVVANANLERGLNLDATNDVTIEVCRASGNGTRGVDASASADVTVIGCITNDNEEQGMALRADQEIVVDGCDALRNKNRPGIEITGPAGGTADSVAVMRTAANDNGVFSNDVGIKVQDVVGTVVVGGSQASGNSSHGFDLRNQGNIYVLTCGATTNANVGYVLDVRGGAVVMRGSTALGHANAGVEIHGQSSGDVGSVLVEMSDIRNGADLGLDLEDLAAAGAHRVSCVNVVGNTANGLILRGDAGATVVAENTWWGAVDGPSGIGPGSGDAIDQGPGTVDFTPWLVGPFETTDPCQQIFFDDWESGTTAAWVGIID